MAPPRLSPEAEQGEDLLMKLACMGEMPTRLEMRLLEKIYWYSYQKPRLYRDSGVSFALVCPPGFLRFWCVKEEDAYEAFRSLYWKGLTEKAIQEQLPLTEECERTITYRFTLMGREAVEQRNTRAVAFTTPPQSFILSAPPTEEV